MKDHSPWCHIYASVNWVNIVSDNGFTPGRRQTHIWTNAVILSTRPLPTCLNEILFESQLFSFKEMRLNILLFCELVAIFFSMGWGVTVYPKKYARGFCFAVLCCGYTLTDFSISIRLTSLALWQSNDCPSASKATLMNLDNYFMWIHYERLHNHNKAKHNKTVCIFLGIYCKCPARMKVNVMAALWRQTTSSRHLSMADTRNLGALFTSKINFNPSMSNHISNKMWNEITYPFANFIMDVITYSCWDYI